MAPPQDVDSEDMTVPSAPVRRSKSSRAARSGVPSQYGSINSLPSEQEDDEADFQVGRQRKE